jgi:hypothetical protein
VDEAVNRRDGTPGLPATLSTVENNDHQSRRGRGKASDSVGGSLGELPALLPYANATAKPSEEYWISC